MSHQSASLAFLAFRLSQWVEGERAEHCLAWAKYYSSEVEMEKPGRGPSNGVPLKDSAFDVYCNALACVKFGWEDKADSHLKRVNMRMKNTPVLRKFPLAVRVGTPQVRVGKE